MADQPFFSIVIPFYNRPDLLPLTVDSILAQKFTNFELILVDDGSTDNSLEVARRYASDRVMVLTKENGERGAARNFGARRATGLYINFFDSDDLMEPDHLENIHRYLQENNFPPVVYTGHKLVDPEGRLLREFRFHPRDFKKALAFNNFLGCNGVTLKYEVFTQFWFNEDRTLAVVEDKEIWLRVIAKYKFEFIPVTSFRVVEHPNRSLNNLKSSKIEERTNTLIRYLVRDPHFMEAFKGRHFSYLMAQEYSLVSQAFADESRFKEAEHYMTKAFTTHPPIVTSRRFLAAVKKCIKLKLFGSTK